MAPTDSSSAPVFLTAEEILGSNDLRYFVVENPEWGNERNPKGLTRCRTLTASERDAWEAMMDTSNNKQAKQNRLNARAALVAKVVVDADGKRVFTGGQVAALSQKSVVPINRIFEKVLDESKVSKDDLEEVEGNFDGGDS